MVQNNLVEEENASHQHFLLFLTCFQKSLSSGLLKSGLCGKELIISQTTNFGLLQTEGVNAFADTILCLMRMVESCPKG